MRQTRRFFLVLLAYAVSWGSQKAWVPLDESSRQGELEIVYIDSFGRPISPPLATASVIEGAQEKRRVAEVQGPKTIRLKYGKYRVEAQCSGAYPVDKVVEIRDMHQTTFIPLFVAPVELPWNGNIVRGLLTGTSKRDGCRWVRFLSVVGSEVHEGTANSAGAFAFENVRPGKYVAVTFGAKGTCSVTEVSIRDEREQVTQIP